MIVQRVHKVVHPGNCSGLAEAQVESCLAYEAYSRDGAY